MTNESVMPELTHDEQGRLVVIRGKLSANRFIAVRVYDAKPFIHLTDTSKCWNTGVFDRSKVIKISYTLGTDSTSERLPACSGATNSKHASTGECI